jgi:phosphatidate cytidylyltransferase
VLKYRVLSAAILIGLLVAAVTQLNDQAVGWVFAGVALLGAWEWAALAGLGTPLARLLYVACVAILLYLIHSQIGVQPAVATSYLWGALDWWALATFWLMNTDFAARKNLATLALKAGVGLLLLIPTWVALIVLNGHTPDGRWLFFVLGLVAVADTTAYFSGRQLGRHKLAPAISPGKTWEGAIGACIAIGLYALAGSILLDVPERQRLPFVLLCLVTFMLSVIGDLFESLMKRQRGVKDSGQLLPGHGGVLDRIDSLSAAAPVFALGAHWLELAA